MGGLTDHVEDLGGSIRLHSAAGAGTQVIAGIFAFRARDSIAATLMMSFATTWLVEGYDPPTLRTRGQTARPGATRASPIPGRL